ncbi:MAG: hypothetical protein GY717_18685 [Rhodobacteraceae bacterium]|nr:hypothetical protein [Paracoccaceae bacterium]
MSDLINFVNALSRPRLLVRAAKLGLADYNRARVLKRLTKSAVLPSPRAAVSKLLSAEESLENARQTGEASYTPSRHVEVLIALLAEARLLAGPGLRA